MLCRELWYRSSLAWQQILGADDVRNALVVAHNAVNQALLNTALGLPPTFFRRLTQTNAATSVVDFQPNGTDTPSRIIDRMNQARRTLEHHLQAACSSGSARTWSKALTGISGSHFGLSNSLCSH